jgi:hypothetical protein
MASSSEKAVTQVEPETTELAVLKLIFEQMMKSNKKLSELTEFAKYIGEKVANIEMRQSLTSGLENDAIRAVSQYAMAESSALPEGAFKKAFDFNKTSEPNTYYKNFFEKDIRRCEYELLKFFEHVVEGKSYLFEADKQHSTGEGVHKLPSIRAKLISHGCNLGELPSILEQLYKVKLPMHRNRSVCTIGKLIERMVVPPTFSTTEVVTEVEAKEIWASLKAQNPKFSMIEWIPLRETLDEKTWHEQLIERILAYNQHVEAAKYGEYCERRNDFYTKEQNEDRKNLAKKAKLQHESALENFWTRHDELGQGKIKLGREIQEKWEMDKKAPSEKSLDKKDKKAVAELQFESQFENKEA